jgi:hypothetical protein
MNRRIQLTVLADTITDRGIMHLKAMPRLKALGIGNAGKSDTGLTRLASLTSLEVLAVKGGSSLTDNGLKPLAGMPKLRALEIYNSRITEQGLPYLYPIKTLDSIQIKSSVLVSERAVASLKAQLPNLQTVDISQPEPLRRTRVAQPAKAMLRP